MSEKDYVLIAQALARTRPHQGNIVIRPKDRYMAGKSMQHGLVVDALMQALSSENPLFNKDKFSEAISK